MNDTAVLIPLADAYTVVDSGLMLREFSPQGSAILRAEAIAQESLIHHREMLAGGTPLKEAHRAFGATEVDFMAVLLAGCGIGLCSRGRFGFIMGARFGFALNRQRPVETVRVANPPDHERGHANSGRAGAAREGHSCCCR